MTLKDFKDSLDHHHPPKDCSQCLEALWWDAKDKWDKAHEAAQDVSDADGSWVHAYLHRKEGDDWNAGYWYSRAGKPKSSLSNWLDYPVHCLAMYRVNSRCHLCSLISFAP